MSFFLNFAINYNAHRFVNAINSADNAINGAVANAPAIISSTMSAAKDAILTSSQMLASSVSTANATQMLTSVLDSNAFVPVAIAVAGALFIATASQVFDDEPVDFKVIEKNVSQTEQKHETSQGVAQKALCPKRIAPRKIRSGARNLAKHLESLGEKKLVVKTRKKHR